MQRRPREPRPRAEKLNGSGAAWLIAGADPTGHHVWFRSVRVMVQHRDIQPALDHLEAALESSCATLVALEATRAQDGARASDAGPIPGELGDAIESLRAAIAELRAMHDVETNVLAFGFVLGADPGWARTQMRGRQTGSGQSSPRRTA